MSSRSNGSQQAAEQEPLNRYFGFPELPSAPLPQDGGRFGNTRLRFTILFALLVVAIATMPLWLSVIIPHSVAWVNLGVTWSFSLIWLVIAVNAVRNYNKLDKMPLVPWDQTFDLRERKFKHIVVVPCYLDPLEILHECVDTLTFQTHPENLIVVITFEAKTPDLSKKLASVRKEYKDKFGDLLILIHQLQPNEIPGGCSNKNFALREAYKFCSAQHGSRFKIERYTITTCDTDSKFHPRYFECLEAAYNAENPFEALPVKMCVWQPPLFYNWNLDERPFFNRVTCIMRTTMMLGGLISFNLNPMSIFSYPLELGHVSGFINPRYGVDDIIAKVRWMAHTNSAVPVKMLSCVAISGPTVGTTFFEELNEWGRQIRRWIVGASESFHYFVIHWRGRPFFAAIVWQFMFFMYYGVLLCASGIFCVLASVPLPWVTYPEITVFETNISLVYAGAGATGLQMLAFGIAFLIDAFGARSIGIVEDINPARNLIHWLSSPFVLLVYSLISIVSVVRFVFEGKGMAKHDMAGKSGLRTSDGVAVNMEQPTEVAVPPPIEKYCNEHVTKVSARSVTSSRSHRDVYVAAPAAAQQSV